MVETEKEGYEANVVEPETDDEVALRPSINRNSRTARKSNPSRGGGSARRNSASSASSVSTKPSPPDGDNSPDAQTSEEIVGGVVECDKEKSGEKISQEPSVTDNTAADAVAAASEGNEQEPMDADSLESPETLIPSSKKLKPAGLQFTEGISNLEEILTSISFEFEPLLQLTKVSFPFTSTSAILSLRAFFCNHNLLWKVGLSFLKDSPARRGRRPIRGHGAGITSIKSRRTTLYVTLGAVFSYLKSLELTSCVSCFSVATKHASAARGLRQVAPSGDIKKSISNADIAHSACQLEGPRR